MRRCIFLAVLTACGNHGTSSVPHGHPTMQLVRCAAAIPRPAASGEVEAAAERPAGSFGITTQHRTLVVGRHPTVTLGIPSVTGQVTNDEVAAAIRPRVRELTACYTVEGGSLVKAAAVYRFVIASDGSVAYVDSSSGGVAGALDSCVRRVLRSITYPVKGTTTAVNVPLVFDSTGTFAMPKADPSQKIEPWTPYAIGNAANTAAATGAAKATEASLRPRLATIGQCFAKSSATGSLRMVLEIDLAGELGMVRVGGIGDRDAEQCTAKALTGMKVMTPLQEHVEVACDLARGDAQPWRLTPSAGYNVIGVERTQLRHAKVTLIPGASDPDPLPAETYVVLAHGDTPGGMLQLALMWAREANGVLLAVVDGSAAPLFLGMGNATSSGTDDGAGDATRPAIRIGGKQATGCVGRATHKANVTSAELGGLVQKLATKCHQIKCAPTLVVAIDSDAMTRDLIEVAGAARRAGFDRVLFGGPELGCTAEVKKKPPDPEPDPDFE